MIYTLLIGLIVGFLIGILFGRKNKKKIESAAEIINPLVDKADGKVKEELDKVLKDLRS